MAERTFHCFQTLLLAGTLWVTNCGAEEPPNKEPIRPSSLAALLPEEIASLEVSQIPPMISFSTAPTLDQVLNFGCGVKTTDRRQIEGFRKLLGRVPVASSTSTRRYEFRGVIWITDKGGDARIITFGTLFSNSHWIEAGTGLEAGTGTPHFVIYKNLLTTILAWQDEFNLPIPEKDRCRGLRFYR